MPYFVNAYETDLAYGGPEEGGWWYDYGVPTGETWGPFENIDDAWAEYNRLHDTLVVERNEGRPRKTSVLGEGEFTVAVEEHEPVAYPAERPFYE
jgi:hypothetical protein